MSGAPDYRMVAPKEPAGFSHETEGTMCAREMEAHTARALHFMALPPDPGTHSAAQVHATLALAWATRLEASR